MRKQIQATVDRIEGNFAILHDGKHNILWPKDDLPKDAKEGTVVLISAATKEKATKDRVAEAKEIINDILNTALGSPEASKPPLDEIESKEEANLEQIVEQLDELNNNLKKE